MKLQKSSEELLETLPGVLRVEVQGREAKEVRVYLDIPKISDLGLSLGQIKASLDAANRFSKAGAIAGEQGYFDLKVPSTLTNLEEILKLPIISDGFRNVYLKDIAKVQTGFEASSSIARLEGKQTVSLNIIKNTSANVIDTVRSVKNLVESQRNSLPEELEIVYTKDDSVNVENFFNELRDNVFLATVIVFFITALFVNMRDAFLVGLAVPITFLLSLFILDYTGYTLNIVVLFALIMSVGMLVDGAIITVEYARRKLQQGLSKQQAYLDATSYMSVPIILGILTTLVVFVPLLFMPEIIGEFLRFIPITLIIVLGISAIVSLVVIPSIGILLPYFGRPKEPEDEYAFLQKPLMRSYKNIIQACVLHPWLTLAIMASSSAGIIYLYSNNNVGTIFFPQGEPLSSEIQIRARGNLSLQERQEIAIQFENILERVPALTSYITNIYFRSSSQDALQDEIGRIFLEYEHWSERPSVASINFLILQELGSIPGVEVAIKNASSGPPQGKDINIAVSGSNQQIVKKMSRLVEEYLGNQSFLSSVSSNLPLNQIEYSVKINRQRLQELGIATQEISALMQMYSNLGYEATSFIPDTATDKINIVLRAAEFRHNLESIENIRITTPFGLVPMHSVADIQATSKSGQIFRKDERPEFSIEASFDSQIAGMVLNEYKKQLAGELDALFSAREEVSWSYGGDAKTQAVIASFMGKAFAASIFLLIALLMYQFGSFRSLLVIQVAIFLAIVGVFLGLYLVQAPYGIVMSSIGIITLAGVVINHNIVLLDTFRKLRESGKSATQAAILSSCLRFRPILLTVSTTVLGLIPMVYRIGVNFIEPSISLSAPSSEMWAQLSTTIAGGLSFSALVSLLITPSLLAFRENYAFKKRQG